MTQEFHERKAKASEMLFDFLRDFTPPRGVDEDAQATRVSNIADAFARRMPTHGDFEEKVQHVFQSIRDTYLSNTWPAQAVFVELMPKWENLGRSAPQTWRPDDKVEHYQKLIDQGAALPETVIWGRYASLIGLARLRPYRKASVASWQKAYQDDAEVKMSARYGYAVHEFMSAEGHTA